MSIPDWTDRYESVRIMEAEVNEDEVTVRPEFTYTFPFEDEWNGTYYDNKELTVYAAEDGGDWVVVPVISRYH